MTNCTYVGMDVHKAITVIVVLNAAGQVESQTQIRTQSGPLQAFFRGLRGSVHVAFEEGTQSTWLYQLLKPLVASVTVFDARTVPKVGQKSDDKDAEKIARLLRSGDLRPIYKGDQAQQQLKDLGRSYETLVADIVRAKNRLKAVYRGLGIACEGREIYRADRRSEFLAKLPEYGARARAELLLDQLAALRQLHKQAKQRFTQQARKHPDYACLLSLPGFGEVRVSQLLAIIGTPHRFRTKRQLWPYAGLSVVTRSTADYQEEDGRIVKTKKKPSTRGLNRNHHPRLKQVFKGAALTALSSPEIRAYYDQQLAQGASAALARVSVARKLASITLTLWQNRKEYDPSKVISTR